MSNPFDAPKKKPQASVAVKLPRITKEQIAAVTIRSAEMNEQRKLAQETMDKARDMAEVMLGAVRARRQAKGFEP